MLLTVQVCTNIGTYSRMLVHVYLCMKEPYLQVSGTDALSGTGGMWHLVGRETIEEGKNR